MSIVATHGVASLGASGRPYSALWGFCRRTPTSAWHCPAQLVVEGAGARPVRWSTSRSVGRLRSQLASRVPHRSRAAIG
eukprot:7540735-Alexandrium_andersonii.AAC.1